MKQKIIKDKKKDMGFTLIEVLISLLLVSIAFIAAAEAITFSLDAHRKSVIRFTAVQKMEIVKNTLLGKNFDALDLADGDYRRNEEKITLSWKITSLTPTLKKIRLYASYKVIKKKMYFYKSKFIN